jgi:hypothetical protein
MKRFQVTTLTLARRQRPPSERNLQIFAQVRQFGERQATVAARHGMSQRRVSQICQQVERWRASLEDLPGQQGQAQRRRASLLFARQRAEQMRILALREVREAKRHLITERINYLDGQVQCRRTAREVTPDVQWLKVADKLSQDIADIDRELGPASAPVHAPETAHQGGTETLVDLLSSAGMSAHDSPQAVGNPQFAATMSAAVREKFASMSARGQRPSGPPAPLQRGIENPPATCFRPLPGGG